jgi:hypothetical protein
MLSPFAVAGSISLPFDQRLSRWRSVSQLSLSFLLHRVRKADADLAIPDPDKFGCPEILVVAGTVEQFEGQRPVALGLKAGADRRQVEHAALDQEAPGRIEQPCRAQARPPALPASLLHNA